jgi:hypothetical protein
MTSWMTGADKKWIKKNTKNKLHTPKQTLKNQVADQT